jgi:hypothetical protein
MRRSQPWADMRQECLMKNSKCRMPKRTEAGMFEPQEGQAGWSIERAQGGQT